MLKLIIELCFIFKEAKTVEQKWMKKRWWITERCMEEQINSGWGRAAPREKQLSAPWTASRPPSGCNQPASINRLPVEKWTTTQHKRDSRPWRQPSFVQIYYFFLPKTTQTKSSLTCCSCEAVANPSGKKHKEKKRGIHRDQLLNDSRTERTEQVSPVDDDNPLPVVRVRVLL